MSTIPAALHAIVGYLPTHAAILALRGVIIGSDIAVTGIAAVAAWLIVGALATVLVRGSDPSSPPPPRRHRGAWPPPPPDRALHSAPLDHRLAEAFDRLKHVRQAVTGKSHLHPRHPHRGALFQARQVGVGVEVVMGGVAAVGVGEGHVDVREVATRGVESASQILDTIGKTVRAHICRAPRLGGAGSRGE